MRITVKTKLGLAFAAVIVLSGITAWLGITNLAAINRNLDKVLSGPEERVEMSLEFNADILAVVALKSAKKVAAKPMPLRNGHAKGKANGFALNLTSGGADQRDAEFERI